MERYKINKHTQRGQHPPSLFDILEQVNSGQLILSGKVHNPAPLYDGPLVAASANGYCVSYPLGDSGREIVFFSAKKGEEYE